MTLLLGDTFMKSRSLLFLFMISLAYLIACEHDGGPQVGNDGGSPPISEAESKLYQRAILKCYKTGGSRVVKIEGELRCF